MVGALELVGTLGRESIPTAKKNPLVTTLGMAEGSIPSCCTERNTMTTLYEKRGHRYYPVAERDAFDAWPQGAHLVVCTPGSQLTRFNVEPDHAALLAAAEVARRVMVEAMSRASRLMPPEGIDQRAQRGWEAYCKAYGGVPVPLRLEGVSMTDIVDAGVDALVRAAKGNR